MSGSCALEEILFIQGMSRLGMQLQYFEWIVHERGAIAIPWIWISASTGRWLWVKV
jgi:hypothetical protein